MHFFKSSLSTFSAEWTNGDMPGLGFTLLTHCFLQRTPLQEVTCSNAVLCQSGERQHKRARQTLTVCQFSVYLWSHMRFLYIEWMGNT